MLESMIYEVVTGIIPVLFLLFILLWILMQWWRKIMLVAAILLALWLVVYMVREATNTMVDNQYLLKDIQDLKKSYIDKPFGDISKVVTDIQDNVKILNTGNPSYTTSNTTSNNWIAQPVPKPEYEQWGVAKNYEQSYDRWIYTPESDSSNSEPSSWGDLSEDVSTGDWEYTEQPEKKNTQPIYRNEFKGNADIELLDMNSDDGAFCSERADGVAIDPEFKPYPEKRVDGLLEMPSQICLPAFSSWNMEFGACLFALNPSIDSGLTLKQSANGNELSYQFDGNIDVSAYTRTGIPCAIKNGVGYASN